MRCVLLGMRRFVEGGLYLLEELDVPEWMCCVRLCMLEVLEVMRCVQLCIWKLRRVGSIC